MARLMLDLAWKAAEAAAVLKAKADAAKAAAKAGA